ncbi:cache domain-containing protein, partial [Sulfurimonas sp.]|uniref:cache domain-containing protein n=1 Tax=Sulfurimonas sp. TaxID=2022749 RepID=UPI0025EBAFD9
MFFTKFFKDEQNILKIIRYQPMVLMLVIVLIMIQVSIQQVNEDFSNEINKVRQDYLDQNKKRVKEEVKRVLYEVEIEKNKSESYLKEKIKLQVDNAYQIIQSIYNKNKNTKSKQEIIKDIKNALQNIRFNNGRGYIFIYDLDATSIFHPTKPQREGKNYFYDKDITGVYRNQIAINIVKEKGEGFFHWFFHKPNDATTEYKKIGFVKGFKEYNWFIGTGEYVLDYENEMKRRILDGINNIKFGDNGYIFVLDKQGEVLSHPLKTLRNKNTYDKKNSRGEYFIQDIISFSNEKKEGFLTHYSSIVPNILNNKDSYKISYIEYYDSWEWIVGSGFYQDILEVNIAEKKELLESIKKSSIKKIIEV